MKTHQKGQSLIEILIAVTVAGLLVGGAAALISVVLQSGTQSRYYQAASGLAQELMDRVTVFAEARWYCSTTTCPLADGTPTGIYNLNKAPVPQKYRLDPSGPSFVSNKNVETVTLNTSDTYTRYFYVENVSRDGSGNIEPNYEPTREDPSTQKITVKVEWPAVAPTQNVSVVKYLTRSRNAVFRQTDWSGGKGQCSGYVDQANSQFCDSTGLDSTSKAGEIKLSP